jgi:hypothetical protein
MTEKKTPGKGNPAWIKGGKSPNTAGRRGFGKIKKNSTEEIRAIMFRVFKKNYSAQKINKMIAGLKSDKERLEVGQWIATILVPKNTNLTIDTPYDKASDEALNAHYNRLKELAKQLTAFQGPIQSQPGQVLFLKSSTAENNGTDQG